jgi:dTDP-4-dehydrorhamnose reductase
VINAAGWVRVDDAEADEAGCFAVNAEGAALLARACAAQGLRFVGFSSDLVFDGRKRRAYVEDDAPAPLNAYGRSKARAEAAVLEAGGAALMIRTAAFFSPFDPHNFAQAVVRSLTARQPFRAAADLVVSPTYTPDLVNATLDLLIDGETGLWHLANEGALTWAEFAVRIGRACGLDERLVVPVPAKVLDWPAARPASVPLASTRGRLMPTLDDAIDRFAAILTSMTAPALGRPKPHPREAEPDESRSFAPSAPLL